MRRTILLVLAGALLVLFAVMAYQGVRTYAALKDVQSTGRLLSAQFKQGDEPGARRSLRRIAADGDTARAHTDNVLWDAAAALPAIGDSVHAVQVLSKVTAHTAHSSLPRAVALFSEVRSEGGLRDPDGRFDLAAIERLAPRFAGLADSLAHDRSAIDDIDPHSLVGPVRAAAEDFQSTFRTVDNAAGTGAKACRLLPAILGADGPRTYLLIAQNNAEIRSTGGLPGSLSLLTARDGRLALVGQRSAKNIDALPSPALPLTREERALFGDNIGEEILDVNITPDFTRTARLARAIVARQTGHQVDGVVSVDVVALAELMKATGPVRVGGQVFTSETVIPILLNRTYQAAGQDYRSKDAFFARTARGLFAYLTTSGVNLPSVLGRLAEAAGQGRLLFWSSVAEEERELSGTRVAGELASDRGRSPVVGAYLNDATISKMSYYLDYGGSIRSRGCSASGVQTLVSSVTLRSHAPEDPSGLAEYVTGDGTYAPKGSMRLTLRVYAPAGGKIVRVDADGRPVRVTQLTHDGHEVALAVVVVKPGQQITLTTVTRTAPGRTGEPVLRMTPGIQARDYTTRAPSTCG